MDDFRLRLDSLTAALAAAEEEEKLMSETKRSIIVYVVYILGYTGMYLCRN